MSRGGAAEPLVTLAHFLGIVACIQTTPILIAACQQIAGTAFDDGVGLAAFLEIVEDEQVRIIAGRGLLEATVRLAQERFQTLLQVGQRRGINAQLHLQRACHPAIGQLDRLCSRGFQQIALRRPRENLRARWRCCFSWYR